MHANAEQRRQTRSDLYSDQLLVVDLNLESPAFSTHGLVLNLSKDGMAVQTFRPLAKGGVAEIKVSLSDEPVLTCKGQVAWEKPGGLAGIRFIDPKLETLPELPAKGAANSDRQSALPIAAYRIDPHKSEFDTTLHLLACCAMQQTGATGAAIALGTRSGVECRASAGNAPEVGTVLRADSGLSGFCLLTGTVVLCDDVTSDPRVNAVAARQMDVSSIIVIPIFVEEDVVGILEAFSRDTKHFYERHFQQLRPLIDVIVEAIKEDAGSKLVEQDSGSSRVEGVTAPGAVPEEPGSVESSASIYSRFEKQPQVLAIVAAVIVLAIALAWLIHRSFARPAEKGLMGARSGALQQSAGSRREGALPMAKPIISFDPPVIQQKVGMTFVVNVLVKGARDLWSAPMKILFNPEKLKLVSVTSGGLLERDGQSATLVERTDNDAGRINISISRPLSAPGISGDGVIFNLIFLSKAAGVSKLRVDEAGLRDTSTQEMTASSSEAVVTISKSESSSANVGERNDAQTQALMAAPTELPENAGPNESSQGTVEGSDSGSDDKNASVRVLQANPTAPSNAQLQSLTQPHPLVEPLIKSAPIAPVQRSDELPSFELERAIDGHKGWVTHVGFSADGQHLISSSWDHSIKVWNIDKGSSPNTIASESKGIQTSAISHNGRLLATEDAANNIEICDAAGNKLRAIKGDRPPWDESWVYSIAFSPNDNFLAAALDGKTVRLWDVKSGNVVRDFKGKPRNFMYMVFSPDGRWLVTGNDGKTIAVWEVATGKLLKILKGHKQEIYAVAFSPDGRWLASGSKDKNIKVWDVSAGQEVRSLRGHGDAVTTVAFSQNGRWLASSSWDKTIKIWNVETGAEVQTLSGYEHQIYSLAFDSRDGSIATGSEDGTIKLWRLRKDIDVAVLVGEHDAPTTASAATVGSHN